MLKVMLVGSRVIHSNRLKESKKIKLWYDSNVQLINQFEINDFLVLIGPNLFFFASLRDHRSLTRLEKVRQLKQNCGKT